MRIKQYKNIIRLQYPKWNGWKILDFYNSINVEPVEKDFYLLDLLEENLYLTKQLEFIH